MLSVVLTSCVSNKKYADLEAQHNKTQQELVERAASDPNTIRAMLVLLEKKGMIKRKQDPNDGRKRHITITRKGRKTYENALKDSEPIRELIYSNFSADELKMLKMFLNRIIDSLESSDILNHKRLRK